MINKTMKDKKPASPRPTPNETGGFYFSSGIKIFDPVTEKIIVHKRGDA